MKDSISKASLTLSWHGKRFFAILIIASCLATVGTGFGSNYYPPSYNWTFENGYTFGFNDAINFTAAPSKGVTYDNSLIGYWDMDEDSGAIVEGINNTNNGNVIGANWTTGKYEYALTFDGVDDYISIPKYASLDSAASISFCCTIKFDTNNTAMGIAQRFGSWLVWKTPSNKIEIRLWQDKTPTVFTSKGLLFADGKYHLVAFTYSADSATARIYIDGKLDSENTSPISGGLRFSPNNLELGRELWVGSYFCGTLDSVHVYNRSLSQKEITVLNVMGPIPDSLAFEKYYNFADSISGNTMLLYVNDPDENSNNTYISCVDFFTDNRLSFQANNTVTVNIWTSLGRPVFIANGVWNNENYTTTVPLNTDSTAELNWNSNKPPTCSDLSLSSVIAGEVSTFSTLWHDYQNLSGGGYIFSTNNSGAWTNSSWTPWSNYGWGNTTLTLNATSGIVIGFREYANNSFNLWGDSEIYAVKTSMPTAKPTAVPAPTTPPSPTPSPVPSIVSTVTPTEGDDPTNLLSLGTIMTLISGIALVTALFVFAFKKGFIKIERIDVANEDSEK